MPLNDNSLDEYPFSFRLFVIINIAIINSAAKIALFFIPAIVFDNLFTKIRKSFTKFVKTKSH